MIFSRLNICLVFPIVAALLSALPSFADEKKMLSEVVAEGPVRKVELKSDEGDKVDKVDEANPDYLDLSLSRNDSEALLYLREAINEALSSNLEIKIESIAPGIASQRIIQALADFDPIFEARVRYENLRTPQTTQEFVSTGGTPIIDNAAGGAGNLPGRQSRLFNEENTRSDVLLTGRLVTGTEYELGVKSNRFSNDLTRDPLVTAIDPEYRAFAGLSYTQPLMQGFGIKVNKTPILISQSEERIASLQFKSIASKIVKEVVGAYYDLYLSYEDVKVKKFDIGVAQVQVAEQREKLERGAGTERDVAIAKTILLESFERFLLARQTMLTKNADLLLRIQTDFDPLSYPVYLPQSAPSITHPVLDRIKITEDALNLRPEYLAAVETVEKMDIELRYRRNQKMPKLDIEATIGTLGLNDGIADAFSEAFDNQGHEYGVGLVFSVPLGNRKSKALYNETQKVSNQAVLRVKWEEVQTNILIDQKMIGVETHNKRINAARHTREFEEMNLERARDNLEKGTSTETMVRVIEHAVLESRLRELAAAGDMQKALLDLWDVNGTLLQRFGILIDTEIDREPTLRFGESGEMISSRSQKKTGEVVSQVNSSVRMENDVDVSAVEVVTSKPKNLRELFRRKTASSNDNGHEVADSDVTEQVGTGFPEKRKNTKGRFSFRKKKAEKFVSFDETEAEKEMAPLQGREPEGLVLSEEEGEQMSVEKEAGSQKEEKSKKFLFWNKKN